jgi:hypothetical protein
MISILQSHLTGRSVIQPPLEAMITGTEAALVFGVWSTSSVVLLSRANLVKYSMKWGLDQT